MALNKLNKTFVSQQALTASEMNQLSSKIDEIVTVVNQQESSIAEVSTLADELNGESI